MDRYLNLPDEEMRLLAMADIAQALAGLTDMAETLGDERLAEALRMAEQKAIDRISERRGAYLALRTDGALRTRR